MALNPDIVPGGDQYRQELLAVLASGTDANDVQRVSKLMTYLKGPNSAPYFTALEALLREAGAQPGTDITQNVMSAVRIAPNVWQGLQLPVSGLDQYQTDIVNILSQNIDMAQKFSNLLTYLKGPNSAAYWTAVNSLAERNGIDPSNQSQMLTQMLQVPAETWQGLLQPVPPANPPAFPNQGLNNQVPPSDLPDNPGTVPGIEQYKLDLKNALGQNVADPQRLEAVNAYVKGPNSAVYRTALQQLLEENGVQALNMTLGQQVSTALSIPASVWGGLQPPYQPNKPPLGDQGTVQVNQYTPEYIENFLKSQVTYENKVQALYDAMDSPEQAQIWNSIQQVAQKYGVNTGQTLRDTIDALGRALIPQGWPAEYYPPVQPAPEPSPVPAPGPGEAPGPIAGDPYGPPGWLNGFSIAMSNAPQQSQENFQSTMMLIFNQYPDSLWEISNVLRQQGVNGITSTQAAIDALWNMDYMGKLNVVANLGGNPQPIGGAPPQQEQPPSLNPVGGLNKEPLPNDGVVKEVNDPGNLNPVGTLPPQTVNPPNTDVPPPNQQPDTSVPPNQFAGASWRDALSTYLNGAVGDIFNLSKLNQIISANPAYVGEINQFLSTYGYTGGANHASIAEWLTQNFDAQKQNILGGLTNQPPVNPANTFVRGQTPVPNQPWARTPAGWQGGEWLPYAGYHPNVEFQETMNALIPWMSPRDQREVMSGLGSSEFYGPMGYGEWSSNIPQGKMTPQETYQYNTSNRIQSARETMLDPWGENQMPLIDPASPVRNWMDAVLREAGRWSPGGVNVPGNRRTRSQQATYDDTMEQMLKQETASTYGATTWTDPDTQQTTDLYGLWSEWLKRFLAPSQYSEPVSSRGFTPSYRSNQYLFNQPGSNRGWGYQNIRWS